MFQYNETSYLSDDKVIEREFGNLLAIPDNYPKLVVSLDEFSGNSTYKGIMHHTLFEFLSKYIWKELHSKTSVKTTPSLYW